MINLSLEVQGGTDKKVYDPIQVYQVPRLNDYVAVGDGRSYKVWLVSWDYTSPNMRNCRIILIP
jgi:hypothetical protein